ncbi:unnamed protein product [Rhodiola kirilowii]
MRFPALTPHPAAHLSSSFLPNTTPSTSNFCFEPTSVLDIRRSPSPVHDHFHTTSISDVLSQTEDLSLLPSIDDHHRQGAVHNLDDWESIMRELGLHDDLAPSALKATFPPNHSPSSNSDVTQFHDLASSAIPASDQALFSPSALEFTDWNTNVGFDFVEELIRAADCFDSGELQFAHVMLSRLNQRLRSPIGKPVQRAAFYFKEALNSLLSVSTHPARPSSLEIVESIRAHKAFSSISPIPMFSDFTTNQAVLESIDSSTFVHIVDFEIGLGGQYASLMREIADRSSVTSKQIRVSIRITAVVQEEFEKESKLVRDNLCQFAHDLQIRFRIDFVSLRTFEILAEKAIEFTEDEKTIVHLNPITFRRTGAKFVTDLRLIVPKVIILVTSEEWQTSQTVSFRESFVEGLEFYSVLLESLDAAAAIGGGEWVRKIEAFVLRRRVVESVETMGGKTTSWREMLVGAGMRPAGLSRVAEFQAECLVRKGEVRGFHVGTRHGELVLSWHGRPLFGTSTWKY